MSSLRRDNKAALAKASSVAAARAAAWNTMYDKLVEFHKTYGHCRIPRSDRSVNTLYKWVCHQRSNAALSQQQRDRLDVLGLDLTTQDQNRKRLWNEMFEKLKLHKQQHGGFLIQTWIVHSDKTLSNWVLQQRRRNAAGKLLKARKDLLDSIGFCWDASKASDNTSQSKIVGNHDSSQRTDPAQALARTPVRAAPAGEQASWDVMYEKLARYYSTNGNYSVSQSTSADLYDWIIEQRVAIANNELSADKRLKLVQIKFTSMSKEEKYEEAWNNMFDSLEAYKAANGHCLVPWSYCEGMKLYNWAIRQREANTTGKLPRHRQDRLQGIGFCWDTPKAPDDTSQSQLRDPAPAAPAGGQTIWDAMYRRLARYYRTNGNCRVSQWTSADLYDWIIEQRVAIANNELSADKRRKLVQINFTWVSNEEKHEEVWNKMFESLEAYQAAKGDCLVTKSSCEDLKLANWVRMQRHVNKTGKLPLHRRDRLQGIGFCWDVNPRLKGTKQTPPKISRPTEPRGSAVSEMNIYSVPVVGERWNLQLERLKIYQAWYGDCLVPTSYDKELAEWVSRQLYLQKINKLGEPRYGKLERIGFFSDAQAEESLTGGRKRGASTLAPHNPGTQPLAGAQELPDETNQLGTANQGSFVGRSRSPKRARFTPSTAEPDRD